MRAPTALPSTAPIRSVLRRFRRPELRKPPEHASLRAPYGAGVLQLRPPTTTHGRTFLVRHVGLHVVGATDGLQHYSLLRHQIVDIPAVPFEPHTVALLAYVVHGRELPLDFRDAELDDAHAIDAPAGQHILLSANGGGSLRNSPHGSRPRSGTSARSWCRTTPQTRRTSRPRCR